MNLRKIVTMGMATLMAVSAMSLSAFACENPEDAIISVLAPDGENRLYLSQEDILKRRKICFNKRRPLVAATR